jgi:hypothetical protein
MSQVWDGKTPEAFWFLTQRNKTGSWMKGFTTSRGKAVKDGAACKIFIILQTSAYVWM